MRFANIIKLFFLLNSFCFYSYAQQGFLSFQNYTTSDGLCDSYILSIAQDERGFIWLGTKEGLSRFDGKQFKNFYASSDATKSFPYNTISKLCLVNNNHLLFLSANKLWSMDCTNSQPIPTSFKQKTIYNLKRFDDMLVIFSVDSIYITDISLKIITSFSSPDVKQQFEVALLDTDRLLFSGLTKSFIYYIKTKKTEHFFLDRKLDEKNAMYIFWRNDARKKSLFYSNFWTGLFEFDYFGKLRNRYNISNGLSGNDVISLATDTANNFVYVGTSNGLNIIDRAYNVIYKYTHSNENNSLPSNIVTNIFIDKTNNVWIGTNDGLSKVTGRNSSIELIRSSGNIKLKSYASKMLKGNGDDLFVNFFGVGTYKVNKRTNEIKIIDTSLIVVPWRSMLVGDELITAGTGLVNQQRIFFSSHSLKTGKNTVFHKLKKFYGDADLATFVYRDKEGAIWYSLNYGGGLLRQFNANDSIQQFNRDNSSGFDLGYAVEVTEDEYDNIYFSNNKGNEVAVWNKSTQKFSTIFLDSVEGIKGTTIGGVISIAGDNKNSLWVTTEGAGLIRYNIKKGTAKHFTIEHGLPTNYLSFFTIDHRNRLWIGSLKGLVCFIPEQRKFITFTTANGLPENDLSGTAFYFDEETKMIWAGGTASLIKFNPDVLLKQTSNDFSVYIDELLVNGNKAKIDTTLSFSYDKNNLQFSFAGVDMENGVNREYAYLLENSDENWRTADENRTATYNNLTAGNYTFKVRARHRGDNKWIEIQQPLSVRILPPWWKTWWFRLLFVTAIITGIIFIVRAYFRRKLEKQKQELLRQKAIEKERTRIATDMHDDFGASLSRIKFLSEKMQLQNDSQHVIKNELEKISGYSDEMAEKMGEIVWALNERYDSLGDLFSYCRSYASDYIGETHQLNFYSNEDIDDKKTIMGEVRRNVFLCYKEALHNIRKHSQSDKVNISFDFLEKENLICINIHDNGKGIDFDTIRPFANGLENMKKRMENVKGNFEIINKNGTLVIIKAPCAI